MANFFECFFIDFLCLVWYVICMVNYEKVILETKAFKTFLQDMKSNRLSHTYLLVSEDQDYALSFAKLMAKNILAVQNKQHSLVKIDKNVHPDVIVLGQSEKIMTKSASEIAGDVYIRPYEEDKKIYILLNMDDVNEEAQNKLLKTIEEPPINVFFILCAKTTSKLLTTILSRSKKIELDLLSSSQIGFLLEQNGVDNKTASICSACSAGVFSRANKMATDKEFLNLYNNVFDCLFKMNSSRDVVNFASIFSLKNVDREELADLMMLVCRDLMMIKTGNPNLINNVHKKAELSLICESFSLLALSKIIEYCLQLKEDLVYNTLSIATIDEFLLKIVEAKVKCKK